MIFHGETTHCRHLPRRHAFRYRMFWLAVDLDELDALDREVAWFGHNRWAIATIRDRDYGGVHEGDIREKIAARLHDAGIAGGAEQITLLTIPRIVGYVFNPVSFYLCRDCEGRLKALIAQVRNTFGEMHHYVAAPDPSEPGGCHRFTLPKAFYVSPFLDVNGEYEVILREDADQFDLQIRLSEGNSLVFSAGMHGTGAELNSRTLISTVLRFPFFAATIMLRIKWQAARLYFQRRLSVYNKPFPSHPSTTLPVRSSVWHRLRAVVVQRVRRAESPKVSEPLTAER